MKAFCTPVALALMLDLSGHETRVAFNGPDGLKTAIEFNPEVVFLDIGLPGMNGYEVAKHIRADPKLKSTLLVAMTGWGTAEDRLLSKNAGFDEHLTKPVEPSTFDEVLARFAKMTIRATRNAST